MSKPSQGWLSVAQDIDAITKKIRASYDSPVEAGQFIAKNWNDYDVNFNLKFLLSPKRSYPALEQATFAAFCSWLIAPDAADMRRSNITSVVAEVLCGHEEMILRQTSKARFALDAMTRITNIGPDFYEEIYYPIGGLKAILKCPSLADLTSARSAKIKEVKRAIFMIKSMHYLNEHCSEISIYNKPSKNIAIAALNEIGGMNGVPFSISENTGQETWRRYEPSMLLLYAASNVRVPYSSDRGDRSFVDATLAGELNYEQGVQLMPEIVGRARFLQDKIGSRISLNARYMLDQAELSFAAPIDTRCSEIQHGAIKLKMISTKKSKKGLLDFSRI